MNQSTQAPMCDHTAIPAKEKTQSSTLNLLQFVLTGLSVVKHSNVDVGASKTGTFQLLIMRRLRDRTLQYFNDEPTELLQRFATGQQINRTRQA
jgi:hypothetical protein